MFSQDTPTAQIVHVIKGVSHLTNILTSLMCVVLQSYTNIQKHCSSHHISEHVVKNINDIGMSSITHPMSILTCARSGVKHECMSLTHP